MKIGRIRTGFLPSLALTTAVMAGDVPAPLEESLWVSDDVNLTIYHVKPGGGLLSSFHSGSISGVSQGVGPRHETLWAAKEGTNQILRYDEDGNTLSSFSGTVYDPAASAPEGVAVDPVDGSLWIVDDDTLGIYNVETDGTLISSFLTTDFDPAASSPQDIATDPLDGSLWITDNGTDRIYNVNRQGDSIGSFHVAAFEPQAVNPQGIAVHPVDRTLWITERSTHTIYNVSRGGTLIAALDTAVFGSLNPTGVVFDTPEEPTLPTLLADIAEGVEDDQIDPGVAERIAQLAKAAMTMQKEGHVHVAAKHLIVFHDTVGKLAGSLIDEALAALLQASAEALVDGMLKA